MRRRLSKSCSFYEKRLRDRITSLAERMCDSFRRIQSSIAVQSNEEFCYLTDVLNSFIIDAIYLVYFTS
jgi:hypothetical protein